MIRYFHWYLSTDEAIEVLYSQTPGTFLVRFSKSSPGSFGIDYVKEDGQVGHIVATSKKEGLVVSEPEGLVYQSISSILRSFPDILKHPLKFSFVAEKWFIGQKTREEALSTVQNDSKIPFVLYRVQNANFRFGMCFYNRTGELQEKEITSNLPSGFLVQGDNKIYEHLGEIVSTLQYLSPISSSKPIVSTFENSFTVEKENETKQPDMEPTHGSSYRHLRSTEKSYSETCLDKIKGTL
jgi:hypothetical protein